MPSWWSIAHTSCRSRFPVSASSRHAITSPTGRRAATARRRSSTCAGPTATRDAATTYLLAEAREQKPLPEVKTIEDLQSQAHVQALAAELEQPIQQALEHEAQDRCELVSYFGRAAADSHGMLAQRLFQLVPAPLLRARFERSNGTWQLVRIDTLAAADIPAADRPRLVRALSEDLAGRRTPGVRRWGMPL